jgi:hypothetical protein
MGNKAFSFDGFPGKLAGNLSEGMLIIDPLLIVGLKAVS